MITEKKMLEKMLLATFMTTILLGQIAAQVHATVTAKTVLTQMQFVDQSTIGTTIIQRNITAQRIDTLWLNTWYIQIRINGTVTVEGMTVGFYFNTTEYPTYKVYSIPNERTQRASSFSTLSQNPVREDWDGITFITTDSMPLHVEYDHPDNGPYTPATYDIPVDEAEPTILTGASKYHIHTPKWQLKDVKETSNIWELICAGGSAVSGIAGLLAALGLIATNPIGLAIVAIILAFLTLVGVVVTYFIENVMETEADDGWAWLWGYGEIWLLWWRLAVYWWMSFGRWRDWGWFFLIWFPRWGGGGRSALHCTY